jgi:hypothetical protein
MDTLAGDGHGWQGAGSVMDAPWPWLLHGGCYVVAARWSLVGGHLIADRWMWLRHRSCGSHTTTHTAVHTLPSGPCQGLPSVGSSRLPAARAALQLPQLPLRAALAPLPPAERCSCPPAAEGWHLPWWLEYVVSGPARDGQHRSGGDLNDDGPDSPVDAQLCSLLSHSLCWQRTTCGGYSMR